MIRIADDGDAHDSEDKRTDDGGETSRLVDMLCELNRRQTELHESESLTPAGRARMVDRFWILFGRSTAIVIGLDFDLLSDEQRRQIREYWTAALEAAKTLIGLRA